MKNGLVSAFVDPLIRGSRAKRAGGLGFCERFGNALANAFELIHHLEVRYPDDSDASSFKRGRTSVIARHARIGEMSPSTSITNKRLAQ